LGLLSAIYSSALACRRFLYSAYKKPQRLPAKVISVGNLTLGGTGKTPAVIAIAEEAKKRSASPCILTRGYKGRSKGPCFIGKVQGSEVRGQTEKVPCWLPLDPLTCGDEPVLMAERLKDVPIVKCADRYKGGMFALNFPSSALSHKPSVFILDDGFQHWNLYRDIDIILIDASDPFGNEKLFPEGRLREPLRSMKRAHVIVLTRADAVNVRTITALTEKIRRYNPDAPVFLSVHRPASLVNVTGEIRDPGMLKNNKVYAFAGIANPSSFQETLSSLGADIAGFTWFRDHYMYKQRDMDKIKEKADGMDIITTEKDLVKLKGLSLPENVFALRVEFEIDNGFYDIMFGNK